MRVQDILAITLICVGVAAIIPNLLFILSLTQVRDRESAFHRFMKSLSVSDVLGSVTFIVIMNCPPGFFGEIDKDNFEFLRALPYVFRSTPWMFFTGYLLTLSCLTWNQHIAVCKPLSYNDVVTKKKVSATLIYIWLISSLQIILPLLVVIVLSMQSKEMDPMPLLHQVAHVEMHIWMAVFIVSILYNIFVNMLIYYRLERLRKKHGGFNRSRQSHDSANIMKKQHAFVTVFLLLLASIFCRLPFPLANIIGLSIVEPQDYIILQPSLVLLLFGNFLVDPIIYFTRMKDVRKGLAQIFHRCRQRNQSNAVGSGYRLQSYRPTPSQTTYV